MINNIHPFTISFKNNTISIELLDSVNPLTAVLICKMAGKELNSDITFVGSHYGYINLSDEDDVNDKFASYFALFN